MLVIGGGPAGMNAAIEAADHNLQVLLLERNGIMGGQLNKQTHKFFGSEKHKAGTRGFVISRELEAQIAENAKIQVWTDATALGCFQDGTVMAQRDGRIVGIRAKATIVATGASEKNLVFPGNDLPGVYGAGAVQTLMNTEGIVPGKTVVMVGAGNIGLIVSYQLLQAGVRVAAVVEAAPRFGGYEVHVNKLRRANVPILTGHTVKYAYGGDHLEGVVLTGLDEHFQPIAGTEKAIKADILCMAVGLSPLAELFFQSGCEMKYIPELGGYVPKIDDYRRTTVKGLYAAGDSSGIEEATSAQLTGRLAALTASHDITPLPDFEEKYAEYSRQLSELRSGPMGGKILAGVAKFKEEGCVNYAR
ncbi:MAG: NAD(P)/FAD-dependent oxidoreductase [Clostridiales bacterium]|nr:NAD(P)/FAD-dependent oxidoreductase [Clostridiales bacterium]